MEKQKWLKKKLNTQERIGVLNRWQKKLQKEKTFLKTIGSINMDNAELLQELNNMTVDELNEVSDQVKDILRMKKEENKQNAYDKFINEVKEGDRVSFTFKGEICQGTVEKINNASFTARFEHENEEKKKPIKFHLFHKKIEDNQIIENDEIENEVVHKNAAF